MGQDVPDSESRKNGPDRNHRPADKRGGQSNQRGGIRGRRQRPIGERHQPEGERKRDDEGVGGQPAGVEVIDDAARAQYGYSHSHEDRDGCQGRRDQPVLAAEQHQYQDHRGIDLYHRCGAQEDAADH